MYMNMLHNLIVENVVNKYSKKQLKVENVILSTETQKSLLSGAHFVMLVSNLQDMAHGYGIVTAHIHQASADMSCPDNQNDQNTAHLEALFSVFFNHLFAISKILLQKIWGQLTSTNSLFIVKIFHVQMMCNNEQKVSYTLHFNISNKRTSIVHIFSFTK